MDRLRLNRLREPNELPAVDAAIALLSHDGHHLRGTTEAERSAT